jgi:hypothetical protein
MVRVGGGGSLDEPSDLRSAGESDLGVGCCDCLFDTEGGSESGKEPALLGRRVGSGGGLIIMDFGVNVASSTVAKDFARLRGGGRGGGVRVVTALNVSMEL